MQYACIALLGSSEAELEDKWDHYYPAYDRVGMWEREDRSGRIPLKSGGLDSLPWVPSMEVETQYEKLLNRMRVNLMKQKSLKVRMRTHQLVIDILLVIDTHLLDTCDDIVLSLFC